MAARHKEDVDELVDSADDASGERSEKVVKYWAALGIDPVEISFPRGGTGLTLREYRVAEDTAEDEDDELEDADIEDAEDGPEETAKADDDVEDDEAPEALDDELDDEEDEDDGPAARAGVAPGEDEAFFLSTEGKLHVFREPASLVAFVKSGAPNALTSGDNWDELVSTLTADLLVADEEDQYELDLVVENLRGGHDVWERDLLVGAGEFARDAAYALNLKEVQAVLAPGSPLDDLDEAIRGKGFFARRKLKKISAEQAALAWRSVIGRLSTSVEWHD